ncbi:hypothetical protein [Paenibacillus solanacearum]|uniref:hypothetical protein n=1 Tax=Paenibacillus solanacearum TaxID=2048548 RepID=UPI001C406211|nr:hypothetical protein [Paenibacillus solanacearum]
MNTWYDFWDQVPGQDFRVDFTPEVMNVTKPLQLPQLHRLSEALAADLHELARSHIAIGFILTLREKIDKQLDELEHCRHSRHKTNQVKRNIRILSSPFHRFHKELDEYRQQASWSTNFP